MEWTTKWSSQHCAHQYLEAGPGLAKVDVTALDSRSVILVSSTHRKAAMSTTDTWSAELDEDEVDGTVCSDRVVAADPSHKRQFGRKSTPGCRLHSYCASPFFLLCFYYFLSLTNR